MALVTATFGIVTASAASALSFCPVFLALLAAQWCGQIKESVATVTAMAHLEFIIPLCGE